ncbi:MAG TPA: hypothetical protein VHO67_13760 [Polyangia bacterium]|nr:hypothetical protein [Polyangia bacterium]
MSGSPFPRLDVSKVGLLIGLAVLAFGVYTSVTYFRPGGHGHGATALRALIAIPVGLAALYLSFSTVCSGCGASLVRRGLSTSQVAAEAILQAGAAGDARALARAVESARGQSGAVRVELTACPQCRRQAQVKSLGQSPRITGDAAVHVAEAVLAIPEDR